MSPQQYEPITILVRKAITLLPQNHFYIKKKKKKTLYILEYD